jgi:hypothetical protein
VSSFLPTGYKARDHLTKVLVVKSWKEAE